MIVALLTDCLSSVLIFCPFLCFPFGLLLCVGTEKVREFNKFAVKRGGKEFSDENISLIERLVRVNKCNADALDMLWQMLQWPAGMLRPVL